MTVTDEGPQYPAIPLSRLADLQAGLLPDDEAAGVRRHVRSDTDAARGLAALDRVRRELSVLGTDAGSAAEVPADVTSRVRAALRELPGPS